MLYYLILGAVLLIPVTVYFYFILKRASVLFLKWREAGWQKGVLAAFSLAAALPALNLFGLWAVIFLHFIVGAAAVDLIRLIFVKASVKEHKLWRVIYCSGIIPICITALILGYGYWNMRQVIQTEYTVLTEKNIRSGGYDIILVSDLHFGTTMDSRQLKDYCEQMEQRNPDLVVLCGDIVDERTAFDELTEAFDILSQIKTAYGIYYVYGNHDKGRYSQDCGFTQEQLRRVIESSGIRILEDETCELNSELTITGRKDRSDSAMENLARKTSGALSEQIPQQSFHILADHQPREMEENAKAGFDLMVSGHTHAGQIWPVGLITTLFDKGTLNYGHKIVDGMDVIVSSGIAGWGYPIRTGKHCEFAVIHVAQNTLTN